MPLSPPPFLRRPAGHALLLLALAGSLGGCTLFTPAPDLDQRRLQVSVPEQWQGPAPARAETTAEATTEADEAAVLAQWWTRFNDPLLDQLIAQGLSASPDLRSAQAKLRSARASRDLAAADYYPGLSASTGATGSKASPAVSGGSSRRTTIYDAGFDASWEPDIFGVVRQDVSAADADVAAQAATLEYARVTLVGEVARNYVELRTYQERLQIARDNASSQAETLEITQWRQQAGLATELDVEQARTSLEQTRATIPALVSNVAASQNRLAVLLGQTPGSLQERLGSARPLPAAPREIAVGIPADALRRRPDVRAAERTLAAETARVHARVAERYPSFTLSGSFGWQALTSGALGGSGTVARSLAGTLAATLFDGGRLKSRIAVQDAAQEQALIAYEQKILTALEDTENALAAYAAGREQEATRRRAAEAARNAAQLARQMYQAGLTDFQKVLDTERTRLSAEDSLATARLAVLSAVIQLYKALGGGWTAPEAPADAIAATAATPLSTQEKTAP